jgi:phospholipase A1
LDAARDDHLVLAALLLVALLSEPGPVRSTTVASEPPYRPGPLVIDQPNYLVAGDWAGQVKFQISLRFGMLAFGPRLSIHFEYTQRSFWAVYRDFSPFRETNYLPEVFASYRFSPCAEPMRTAVSLAAAGDWDQRLGQQARDCRRMRDTVVLSDVRGGVLHESNGTAAPNSRSWNRLYLRASIEIADREPIDPTEPFEDPPSWYLRITPRVWLPFALSPWNADITDYRGYGDLTLELGARPSWLGRLVLEIIALKGVGFTTAGSVQTSLFWLPWKDGGFRPWIDLQWWVGYGEHLLRYNQFDDLLRVGLAFRR